MTLHLSTRRSFAPLEKSRLNHRSYVWTETLSRGGAKAIQYSVNSDDSDGDEFRSTGLLNVINSPNQVYTQRNDYIELLIIWILGSNQ